MQIVDGTAVPPGKRGFLFSKFVYEDQLKLKTARRLDKIKDARDARGTQIAKDPDLQRMVRENVAQVREVLLQLDAPKTADLPRQAAKGAGQHQRPTSARCWRRSSPPTTRTSTAATQFFYDELAPSLELYRIRIGDTLTIKAFTRSGYVQSVNLHVYGTFQFQGLEKSTLAGALEPDGPGLVPRALRLHDRRQAARRSSSCRRPSGAHEVSRENAEAELFGTKETDNDTAEGRSAEAARQDASTANATPGRRRRRSRTSPAGLGQRLRARGPGRPGLRARRDRAAAWC